MMRFIFAILIFFLSLSKGHILFESVMAAGSSPLVHYAQTIADKCKEALSLGKKESVIKHPNSSTAPIISGPREVGYKLPIKNQCSLGTCHIQSTLSYIEALLRKKNVIVELSPDNLVASHLVNRALDTIKSDSKQFTAGGNFVEDILLILQSGLVPRSSTLDNATYSRFPSSRDLMERIQTIILKYRRKFETEISPESRNEILSKAKQELVRLMQQSISAPEYFCSDQDDCTPKSYADMILKGVRLDRVKRFNIRREKTHERPHETISTYPIDSANQLMVHDYDVTPDAMLEVISNVIDQVHLPLIFESYWKCDHFDRTNGVLSLQTPAKSALKKSTTSGLPNENNCADGWHQMLIVGYEREDSGIISKLKIQNSYGSEMGQNGYLVMHRDYFTQYARNIQMAYSPEDRKN